MDALFLPLATALGASVDQIKVLLTTCRTIPYTDLDASSSHVFSSHTRWEVSSCACQHHSPRFAIFSALLSRCSFFFLCSRYIPPSSSSWGASWPRISLPNTIRAAKCLGLSLCTWFRLGLYLGRLALTWPRSIVMGHLTVK